MNTQTFAHNCSKVISLAGGLPNEGKNETNTDPYVNGGAWQYMGFFTGILPVSYSERSEPLGTTVHIK